MQDIKVAAFGSLTLLLTACGGGTSSPAPQSMASAPISQPVSSVKLSGQITYDRVPHTTSSGLDYANTIKSPVRGVIVEAVSAAGSVLETTAADINGNYSFTLEPDKPVESGGRAAHQHWRFGDEECFWARRSGEPGKPGYV